MKKAAKACNEKNIELIHQKDLLPLTGYVHGGCSPIGMKKKFLTFIDLSSKNYDSFCVSGGKIGYQIEISPLDLANFADNRVDAFIGYNESILSASAGLLLAKESGAFMSGYNVKNEELKDELFYTDYLIVSNQKLKAELEEFIKKA